MKITQITDLHIGLEGEDTYEVDVRNNFLRLLEKINTAPPDHLVITGDLCYRSGNERIYRWIKEQLAWLTYPFSIIPGNHDDPVLMANTFGLSHLLQDGEFYFRQNLGEQTCMFLDSTTGAISTPQLSWLERQLAALRGRVLIFVHHPPLPSGVPFMDQQHRLRNHEEFTRILWAYKDHIYTFSGHYHVDKTISSHNLTSFITPSNFMQIDQYSEAFKVDHYQIGYREIVLNQEWLQSTVRYLEGARL